MFHNGCQLDVFERIFLFLRSVAQEIRLQLRSFMHTLPFFLALEFKLYILQ